MKKRNKSIELGQALAMKRYYEKKPKRLGLWGFLVLSNLTWIAMVVFLWTGLWSSTKLGVALTDFYLKEKNRWAEVTETQQKTIEERNMEIARMVAFQTSSPGDVVRLAETVSSVLNTARGDQRTFLEKALPEAIRLQVQTNVPASAIISMSIYESGYGRSSLAAKYNNFFGIKAFSNWDGPRARNMPTVDSGVPTRADFRAYPSVYDGFLGYATFLRETGRYHKAFSTETGPEFVRAVLAAGYCPDGDYLGNIKTIMARHNLTELDTILEHGATENAPYQVAWNKLNKEDVVSE